MSQIKCLEYLHVLSNQVLDMYILLTLLDELTH